MFSKFPGLWYGTDVNRQHTTSAHPAFGGISLERKQRRRQCASGILSVPLVCSVPFENRNPIVLIYTSVRQIRYIKS